jgi:hypothetical protein
MIPFGNNPSSQPQTNPQLREQFANRLLKVRVVAVAYLVWLVAEARLEWFCLEDDEYRSQMPDAEGVLHSRVFPGLRLPVAPLLAGDTAKVLEALTGHEPLNRKPPETSVKSEG